MIVKYTKMHFLFGMVVSVLMSMLGIFVVAPYFGFAGLFWTAFCLLVAIFNGYALFSNREYTLVELEMKQPVYDLDAELRKLSQLKEDGLITEEEFQTKRAKIMERHLQ